MLVTCTLLKSIKFILEASRVHMENCKPAQHASSCRRQVIFKIEPNMNLTPTAIIAIVGISVFAAISCNNTNQNASQPTAQNSNVPADIFKTLIDSATKARNNAYAPYSKFLVGSAVLAGSGAIYTGCNVENASFGLTNCAERTAIFKAISAGEKRIKAVAVVTDVPELTAPCGACRQVIYEFGRDVDVIMANLKGKQKIEKISKLLPDAFGPGSF